VNEAASIGGYSCIQGAMVIFNLANRVCGIMIPNRTFRFVEASWPWGLMAVIASGSVIVFERLWVPNIGFFSRQWFWWICLICGFGALTLSILARLVNRVRSILVASQQTDNANQKLAIATQNIGNLGREERLLLLEALNRHPRHIEVLEFGPGQSLIRKDIFSIVGQGQSTTVFCELHPWIVQHRGDLIRCIEQAEERRKETYWARRAAY
jgi:hypothetical protein